MKFLTDLMTGKDNLTFDAARVVGVIGALAYIGFWCIQVWHVHRFEPADADAYGKGLGMVLLAMAGAVMLKKSTEPEPHEAEDRMRDRDREHEAGERR